MYKSRFRVLAYGRALTAMGAMMLLSAGCGAPQTTSRGTTVDNTVSARMAAQHEPRRVDSEKPPMSAAAESDAVPGDELAMATSDEPAAGAGRKPPRPIALLNGQPISRTAYFRKLLEARGLEILQQVLLREVAEQEARKLGIEITPADVDREYDITAHAEHMNGKDIESLTPARRESIIEEWTRSRGVSKTELAIAIEKQAILRKIVMNTLEGATFTDEQLQREHRIRHGDKAQVRHIQFSNERTYQQIRQRLDLGERFEDLVSDYSQNVLTKIQQGLMPAFSAEDPTVPPILAKAAFQMKPGDVSNAIEVDGYFHVLKLERFIPADGVTFEEARPALEKALKAQLVTARMEELGRRLFLTATLQIEDQTLRTQYKERQRVGRIEGPPLVGQ